MIGLSGNIITDPTSLALSTRAKNIVRRLRPVITPPQIVHAQIGFFTIFWQRSTRWLLPLLLALVSTLMFGLHTVHAQTPAFDQRRPFGAPVDLTNAVAVGDMDGDGDLDILVATYPQPLMPSLEYKLVLNQGDGHFATPRATGIGTLDSVDPFNNQILLGDLDGDGDLDVVAYEFMPTTMAKVLGDLDGDGDLDLIMERNKSFRVYLNDGVGNFTQSHPFASLLHAPPVNHRNGESNSVDDSSGAYLVYRNDGAGNFAAAYSFGPAIAGRVTLGDMDGDHDLDFISVGSSADLYFNDGKGNFPITRTLGSQIADAQITAIQIADLDGDRDQDLIVGKPSGQSLIYLNDGAGHFSMTHTLDAAQAVLGDIDSDGDLDIAAIKDGHSTIFLNDGAANFTELPPFSSAADRTRAVALGDLDGDNDLDVIAGGSNGPSLVYLNNGAGDFVTSRLFGAADTAATQVEVGDMNGDHNLDLIVAGTSSITAAGALYLNAGDGSFSPAPTFGLPQSLGHFAIGDMDGDGDLDMVNGGRFVANPQRTIYFNDGSGNLTASAPFDTNPLYFLIPAVGDLDNDGDLDIVGGRSGSCIPCYGQSLLYFNDGVSGFSPPHPFGKSGDAISVALGDVDNDGDLDIVIAYYDFEAVGWQPFNTVYLNDGHGNFPIEHPFGLGSDQTNDMALADIDGDGDLDIIAANSGRQGTIYLNDGLGNFTTVRTFGSWIDAPQQVALADIDGDGDLDILANGNSQHNLIYLNDGAGNFATSITFPGTLADLATGDMDRDGNVDIITVNAPGQGVVYLNRKGTGQIVAKRPGRTALANFLSTPEVLSDRLITIPYTLKSPDSVAFGSVAAFYSVNGGGKWQPAIASLDTITQNLTTAPNGVEHYFTWDTYASGFFGQADSVVIRLVAYAQTRPASPTRSFRPHEIGPYTLFLPLMIQSEHVGAFRYTNLVAGPYQHPFVSTVTLPFRLRGTQVRVLDSNGKPAADAQVYRLPKGSSSGAESFPVASQPLTTTGNGYLPGRGALAIGDQLVAFQPMRRGRNYTVYATSAAPDENGLAMQPVTQPGVQTLQVSADHPLLLFDLDISLEWDAGKDGLFYDQLTTAIERTSAILYDASDGQIALGEVRLHPNRAKWQDADVVIYANNNLRPRASMGGVVDTAQPETQGLRGNLPNAYAPGQVRIGPVWDPFGQNNAELTQDWQRALAHELAHYLLFLPDNYIGVDNGLLRITDCRGSIMTDAYNPAYSEFLTPLEWHSPDDPALNPCLRTVAAKLLTGRSDWETVTHFYPELHIPEHPLVGPALLPLNVTHVRLIAPAPTAAQPVAARNYDLRDESGEVTVLRQAQAYVLQSQGTLTLTDDALLYLGSTGIGSDRMLVRGALVGDKVCVIDSAHNPVRTGCETVTPQSTSLQVLPVSNWRPDIQVTPLTSTTFQITVTQAVSVGALVAQFLPAYGPTANAAAIQSVSEPLTPLDATRYTARITTRYPVFEGFVRVYAVGAPEQEQAITQVFLSDPWGPSKAWNGANRAWGANIGALEAPAASGDGKVTILNLTDLLADTGTSVLQAVTDLPHLPPWLTPVGPGYRFAANRDLSRTLMFQYNQRDVPPGYEQTLALYYLPEGSTNWQRLVTGPLPTGVDPADNLATATMPAGERGAGIYALMATVELLPLTPGWNPFNYPVVEAQPITHVLASLGTAYTTVYAYQPTTPLPWPVYDRTVDPAFAPLVNTLTTMTFTRNYLIYATQVVTPYIGVSGAGAATRGTPSALAGLVEPPALFYGALTPPTGFVVAEAMAVKAQIGTVTCGQSQIQRWQGVLVFVIQVKADSGDGCGKLGQPVQFEIGGQVWPLNGVWDNRQANQLGNAVSSSHQATELIAGGLKLYLPVVAR